MTNKKSTLNTVGRIFVRNNWSAAVLAVTLAMSGWACSAGGGGNLRLSTSPTLPAAQGNAKFSVTNNDNTRIALTVKHLAHPEKLTPPASDYVIWTRATKYAPAQNIGALIVDKDLNGKFDGETPLHSFELFITAEASGEVQQPSGQLLLWTNYSR